MIRKKYILLFIILFCTIFTKTLTVAEPLNPFKPLFKNNSEQTQELNKNKEDINSLLKYDISQLRLAAILQSKNKKFALVEDKSGRGYIIVEGDKIGSDSDSVIDICKDKIIIKNIFGIKREIFLNREAEE